MTDKPPQLHTELDAVVDRVELLEAKVRLLQAYIGLAPFEGEASAHQVIWDKARAGFEAYRGRAREIEDRREWDDRRARKDASE
jgi:hypothetical protein